MSLFITIEGTIGIGKTTIAEWISELCNMKLYYEVVEDNPYLKLFYEDKEKYSYLVEKFFLASRVSQNKEIKKNLEKNISIVADYDISKTEIFVNDTLHGIEREDVLRDYQFNLENSLVEPDIRFLIISDMDDILRRIQLRGREMEKDIDVNYLQYLQNAYSKYQNKFDNVVILDLTNKNVLKNQNDRKYIENIICNTINDVQKKNAN